VSSTYILRPPPIREDARRTQRGPRFFRTGSYRDRPPPPTVSTYIMLPPDVQDLARQQWTTLTAGGKPLWPPATN